MWGLLAEWCADIFAATSRGRKMVALPLAALGALAIVALVLAPRMGAGAIAPILVLVALAAAAAVDVFVARASLQRTASLPLDDPRQSPAAAGGVRLTAPTAANLHALTEAVDHARRQRYAEAAALFPLIERSRLMPEEMRLLDAVRALVSLGLGDDDRAAQQAAAALPTGSNAIDECLGRHLLARAWPGAARLLAIDEGWQRAGIEVGTGPLGRLRKLVALRLGSSPLAGIPDEEARRLAEEARAVGDPDLAADLEALARTPRGYR